ncbi:MAG: 2-keto-4-pentenoate hydratase [Microcoleaceae cyanobacterium]
MSIKISINHLFPVSLTRAIALLIISSGSGILPSLLAPVLPGKLSQHFSSSAQFITNPRPTNINPPETKLSEEHNKFLNQIIDSFLDRIALETFPIGLTMTEAQAIQDKFVIEISDFVGRPVGYKVALSNRAIQQAFGVKEPIRGRLFDQMFLKTGSTITTNFGVRPLVEGDLIVRIASDNINQAETLKDVLKNIDAVYPFLELPDILYSENLRPNAVHLVATNAGVRYGVLGEPILINDSSEWASRLQQIRVELVDAEGRAISAGNSQMLLGNPLSVVLWLKDSLQSEGKRLKRGDLVALGSITSPLPVEANTTIRARYLGLTTEPIEISIGFKESRSPQK